VFALRPLKTTVFEMGRQHNGEEMRVDWRQDQIGTPGGVGGIGAGYVT